MLRQIARLGRPVPAAGPRALAVAVYGDEAGEAVPARESRYEGVACVDDAARALELYCDLWEATQLPWALRWCEGLLDFVLAMQESDGRFVNFILDWEGAPNRVGRTSIAGGAFWQARAVAALAHASRILDDERIDGALQRGLGHITAEADVPADVRALHVMALLRLPDADQDDSLRGLVGAWSDAVMGCRDGAMLMNWRHERGRPHLWGHIQEGVLADAGARLHRDDLVSAARTSADAVFAEVVSAGFPLPRTQPYDVASAVYALSRLTDVTGAAEYGALADTARAWFDGRNPAARPVYDRTAGRVADGIDGDVVSSQSGAEANIVGAQALFADAVALARQLSSADALPACIPGALEHLTL